MKKLIILTTLISLLYNISPSRAQNGLHFDGSNDFVQTSFGGVTGTNARTFEAWVKVNAGAPSTNLCIMDYGSSAAQSRNTLSIGASRNLVFIAGGVNTNMSSGTNTITVGQWNHVAFVLSNGTGYMYINGSLVGTGNLSNVNTPTGSTNLRIGERVSGGSIPFEGSIDEVRIWDVARTATEIANNRNAEFCTLPPNLKAYYTFNHGTAGSNNSGINKACDAVSGKDGTLNNFSLSGTTSNWVTGSGITLGLSCSKLTTTECDSFVSPSGNFIWTTTGKYQDTLTNSNNCDSLINVNLTIKNSQYNVINDTVCEPYVSPSGKYTYTSSGTYFDTVQLSNGCFGFYELNLSITVIDTTVLVSGNTMTSNHQNAFHYIWLDCDNDFAQISGTNNQAFTPSQNGNYAVRVTDNACVDTSACTEILYIGIEDENANEEVALYPNPVANTLNISTSKETSDLIIEIISPIGKVIHKGRFVNQIDVSSMETGLYWINIIGEQKTISRRFLKQ